MLFRAKQKVKVYRIAVEFDGTIVNCKQSGIGDPIPEAIETLLNLKENGHLLILWTRRAGAELDDAIRYCQDHGLEFYTVNRNYPEEKLNDLQNRKINADFFIDHLNLGGLPSWRQISEIINQENERSKPYKSKRNWLNG